MDNPNIISLCDDTDIFFGISLHEYGKDTILSEFLDVDDEVGTNSQLRDVLSVV